jgi:hypothetical protein
MYDAYYAAPDSINGECIHPFDSRPLNSDVASKEQLTNLSAGMQERTTGVYYAPQPEGRDEMNADDNKSRQLNEGNVSK